MEYHQAGTKEPGRLTYINTDLQYVFKGESRTEHAAAAATKSLQSCPTLCNPMDGSPPGSPSLGCSRQEHWSGSPFPSPTHESEKRKWSCSVMSDSSRPHGLQPTRLLCPWDFPGKCTGVGCHCLLCRKHTTWKKIMKTAWDIFESIFLSCLPPSFSSIFPSLSQTLHSV